MQSSSDVFGQARPCKAGAGNLVVMRIRMEVRRREDDDGWRMVDNHWLG